MNYPFFENFIKLHNIDNALINRETCPHWIDFEIYDSLDDRLKKVYLEQFKFPEFSYMPNAKENVKFAMRCRANHNDLPSKNYCDCSEHYKKTIELFSRLNGGFTIL